MAEWIQYLLILTVVCAIYFVITGVWVGLIDWVMSGLKKIFRINNKPEEWHSLEDIRKDKKK